MVMIVMIFITDWIRQTADWISSFHIRFVTSQRRRETTT